MATDDDPACILALQHIGCEPPAAYEDELLERGFSLERVRLDEGEPLPDWRGYRGVIVMGGPMGAYDDAEHPWLTPEKRLIAEAARAGKPLWGVCLGAQLLAASLGAVVAPGPRPEVGVLPVQLTPAAADDRVFAGAPASFPAFQWHGDTYELPPGAIQLARSESYEQQAFVFANAYALQFHIEVTPSLVAEWAAVPAYAGALEQLGGDDDALDGVLEQLRAAAPDSTRLARDLFARWLTEVC